MGKNARSKSQSRSHAPDTSAEFCKKNNCTPKQYAMMLVHMQQGHAPAPAGRGRGSSQARSTGGRSGRTSRAASQDPVQKRDLFKDAVRMRYKEACEYYRISGLWETQTFSRDQIMAKAYEMQRLGKNHNANVIEALIKGHAHADDATNAAIMFPDLGKQEWTHKKISDKSNYAKKWIVAMQSMNHNNYLWYEYHSKRELRALLLQQCHDVIENREMPLQEYIATYHTPKVEWLTVAAAIYKNDSEIKEPHPYETRKYGPQYMTPKYMEYRTPNHHFHMYGGAPHAGGGAPPHAGGGALHMEPLTAPRSEIPPRVSNTGLARPRTRKDELLTQPLPTEKGSYAHDDFGDEVPDDYRV